jgi:hypothetical protein
MWGGESTAKVQRSADTWAPYDHAGGSGLVLYTDNVHTNARGIFERVNCRLSF